MNEPASPQILPISSAASVGVGTGTPPGPSLRDALSARFFFNGPLEYLLIGGVLSLITVIIAKLVTHSDSYADTMAFATVILLANGAHFGSSTVRLYTKPGTRQQWPNLTMIFPLLALGILTVCLAFPRGIGTHLQSLYLTWTPYHYAAQAYGLAVMYSFRSGCMLAPTDKKLLWWVCMSPVLYAWLTSTSAGLLWFLQPEQVAAIPLLANTAAFLEVILPVIGFGAPVVLFLKIWRTEKRPMPLISLVVIVTNGAWWFLFRPMEAFLWATVFHSIQYLAIMLVFHLKDQMQAPSNRHSAPFHAVSFYLMSAGLGYALFQILPWTYTLVGFGLVESILLVGAAVNLHHFIVDSFIWRLRKDKDAGNNRVLSAGAPEPAY